MTTDKTQGQKLIHGIIHNWLDETGEIPTHDNVVTHIFTMTNDEFNAYLNQEDYFFRKEMHEEGERQSKLIEEKKPRVKRRNEKLKNDR